MDSKAAYMAAFYVLTGAWRFLIGYIDNSRATGWDAAANSHIQQLICAFGQRFIQHIGGTRALHVV